MTAVTIWNEFRHEKEEPARRIYPEGIHNALRAGISCGSFQIRCATLDEPECGLPDAVLESTQVLLWWGHRAHGEVPDLLVEKIAKRVLSGMGLVVLHSGHNSKIFRRLMGTSASLRWRQTGERERIWTVDPSHPITRGIPETFALPHEEMYGERFDVPDDGKIIFLSWFAGGEVFRSGLAFQRGAGKIFYFAPGHETFPTYYDKNVLNVISNAVRWAAPEGIFGIECRKSLPLEPADNPARNKGAGSL